MSTPTPTLTQSWIDNTLATDQAGRKQDAVAMGQQVGNPWLINIAKSYQSIYGRNPTPQEVAQATPAFQAGGSGEQFIANLKAQQDNTPEAIANKQNKEALDKYNSGADTYNGQVNGVFQSGVGRDATAAEKSHFGALLASGQIDQYGLGQLVGGTQEAQQRQTSQYQDTLSKNLQGTQGDYYKNQILPNLQSAYAKQGRSFDSSAFQNAAVGAGQQQNYQLQNYLAQFGAGQYGQSAQNQQGQYGQYLNDVNARQGANVSNALGTQQWITNQGNSYNNYSIQQQAYNDYLSRYGKRGNATSGALGGAASGASIGTSIMPGWGTAIGAGVGAAAGYFGSQY